MLVALNSISHILKREEAQVTIEQEKAELASLTYVPVAQLGPDLVWRCHWCGQLCNSLSYVETVNGIERRKGDCCAQRPT